MHIATKSSKIDISSEKKLEEFANKYSKKIKAGDIYFLYGDIGVGKTTFVKYIINSIQFHSNLKKTEVTSPTFSLLNEYEIGSFLIKHYDLYRLKSEYEVKDLNLFEKNDKSILFIEWPQIIKEEPNFINKLYFEYEDGYQNRFIKL
tara:strand:+ start:142 stop:582 length:441 start_codon:yes stop_codon:yes gene_type:complete